MSRNTVRRAGAVALAGALATGLSLVGPAAHAATDPTPVAKGAGWIQGQLKSDGLLHAAYPDMTTGHPVDYADYGGTVELAYALDAVGKRGKLPAITAGLEASVDSYITGGSATELYAGPTGKLLAFVTDLSGGADPHAFGGTDLVARMEQLTTDTGRIQDTSAYGDYANVYGQIWATRGLLNVGSSEAAAAESFLLTQQCSDGHFLSFFTDSCDTTAAGPDAAAFAVILLHDKAASDPALATALTKAAGWLASVQQANGSFADDNGQANADSTGLAAWALRLEGKAGAARKAAEWLRSLQVPGAACDGKLSGKRGAIAYDAAAYREGRSSGIGRLVAGQWQTVAAQALPALLAAPGRPGGDSVDGPQRVSAGGTAQVKVALAPGERACVGIGGAPQKSVVGPADGSKVTVTVAVPKKTGRTQVRLYIVAGTLGTRTIVR